MQLQIDKTLTKEKQKSQAKSILQQKHRALAELFTNLSKLGLSYRTGIIEAKLRSNAEEFLLKPLDLEAALSHLEYNKNDEKILTFWQGCEGYYNKSLMRLDVLQTALQNPAKDLGLQNVERCKGFAITMFSTSREQKVALTRSSRNLYYLRYYQKFLSDFCEHQHFIEAKKLESLTSSIKNVIGTMKELKIVLNAVPEDQLTSEDIVDTPVLEGGKPNFIAYKFDSAWNNCLSDINSIINNSEKLLMNIKKRNISIPAFFHKLVDFKYLPVIDTKVLQEDIAVIQNKLLSIGKIFSDLYMNRSINYLIEDLANIDLSVESVSNSTNVSRQIEDLVQSILVSIQTVYIKYEAEKAIEKESHEEEASLLEENHLKSLIVHELKDDLSKLEMKNILNKTIKLALLLANVHPNNAPDIKTVVSCALPLLDQIILLYEYFVTQQVLVYRTTCKMTSILTNIFIELASKGFCIPPELSDENDSEGQTNKQSGGMGLGDGEGEKDASDRIESEDQLEDAHPAGQEKKQEEDKDCKEEEKGIEMSDDFDSKLQDVDKKDDDDESNDDSDADEQMGETEDGADKLDQEVWGSDEEDVEENGEDGGKEEKEEKGNQGQDEGDQQMGAKDDNNTEENDNNSKEEKKEKKNDIDDMKEPEFDDDQVDPFHGKQPELPEPEPLDLPDDMQLDEGQEKEDEENNEENPFDIDTMKGNIYIFYESCC